MRAIVNRLRARPRHYLAACCLLLGGVFYARRLFDFGYIHGDEGVALMGGWRIFLGQLPGRDFFEIFPPLSFLPTALFFKLFGPNFFAERLLALVYAVCLIAAGDDLLRRLTRSTLARWALASFLIPFGVLQWMLPSHHWLVDILQLLALSCLLRAYSGRPPWRWGMAAGALIALACFTMQDQGGYLAVALLVLFFPLIDDRRLRKCLFLAWLVGGATVAAGFALYLLPHVPLSELIYQWLIFPATRYRGSPGNTGSLLGLGWQEIGSPAWRSSLKLYADYTLAQTVFSLVLPLLPVAAVVILAVEPRAGGRAAVSGLLFAGWLAFVGGCLHRLAQTNLIWAAPLFLVVVAAFSGAGMERGDRRRRLAGQALAVGMICLGVAYAAGNYRRIGAMDKVQVSGPAGTLTVPARSTESSMQLVIDAIEKVVPREDSLFCTEYNPEINFWTQRRNPTPYNLFISPNFNTRQQAEEVIDVLSRRADIYVLIFIPLLSANDRLGSWILNNYQVVWRFPWALLMRKP